MAIGLFQRGNAEDPSGARRKETSKKLEELQDEMEHYVLPIRELPGKERKKHLQ